MLIVSLTESRITLEMILDIPVGEYLYYVNQYAIRVERPTLIVSSIFPRSGILDWIKRRKDAEQLCLSFSVALLNSGSTLASRPWQHGLPCRGKLYLEYYAKIDPFSLMLLLSEHFSTARKETKRPLRKIYRLRELYVWSWLHIGK